MRWSGILLSLFIPGLCGTLHADTFKTFDLYAPLKDISSANTGLLSGTLVLDDTTHSFVSLYVTATATDLLPTVFTSFTQGSVPGLHYYDPPLTYVVTSQVLGVTPIYDRQIDIFLPVGNLINYNGSGLCYNGCPYFGDRTNYFQGYSTGFVFEVTPVGALTLESPVAATPEPTSLLLLGSGLLCLAGSQIIQRRSLRCAGAGYDTSGATGLVTLA